MTIYFNEQMNKTNIIHTKLLTETLLLRTITMDTALRTLLRIVVPTLTSTKRGVLERIVEPPL